MNSKQRQFWYQQVLIKQGDEYCVMCCKTIPQLVEDGQSPKLCLDHKDNNNNHNEIDNLQFLCKSCNTKKNHPETTIPFSRSATPEMSSGKRFESDFRRWVSGQYMENENLGLEYDYLKNTGAEVIGCSQETIKRYLGKMTSSEGIYEWEDRFGGVLMVLKPEYKNR